MTRFPRAGRLLVAAAASFLLPAPGAASFVNFESQHIHPLALSDDGATLFVVNTPDARLAAFDVTGATPVRLWEVPVGLEPVTVAVENEDRVWVVNHLSDAVSIVDVPTRNVIRTIQTGDEPTDVLFTPDPVTPGEQWAWVCISQENVIEIWDAEDPAAPLHRLAVDGSDPRAMAHDSVRGRVFVAIFESGSATTIVPRDIRADPTGPWGGQLPPFVPALEESLPPVPDNGVIVKWDGADWVDEQGGVWTDLVDWHVTDIDVVGYTVAPTPTPFGEIEAVGTLLFDIAVDEGSGDVIVSNTDAHNDVLFEPKLRGRFVTNQLTRIPGGSGAPDRLPLDGGTPGSRLSQPGQLALRADGSEVFYTMMGSEVIGVNGPSGAHLREITYREGGTGLALDESRDRLYVVNRFTNSLDTFEAASGVARHEVPIGRSGWDPTPTEILDGRRFLYSAAFSQNGDAACATCHPFAGFDNLAWDLGNPEGTVDPAPPASQNNGLDVSDFHPVKGPMTTQTLRGLLDTGFLHWRGDRDDFLAFNGAFTSLLGGPDTLSADDMQRFNDFIMTVTYPPNPYVNLDNTLSTAPPDSNPAAGHTIFTVANELDCDACHTFPQGTNGFILNLEDIPGFGGQPMKMSQLRNMYEKTGFENVSGDNDRGFGYLHDGGVHSLREFTEKPVTALDATEQPHMIAFLLSFPTGTAAATGHAITVASGDGFPLPIPPDLLTMQDEASAGNIELIAKGVRNGEHRGFRFDFATGRYQSDRALEPQLALGELVDGAAPGEEITFLGVPPLTGTRMGIDRDLDGWYDRDELDAGSDPADPGSVPPVDAPSVYGEGSVRAGFRSVTPNPFGALTSIRFGVARRGLAAVNVYSIDGRLVKRIARSVVDAGDYEVRWDGRDDGGLRVASGVYFLMLRTESDVDTRRVTVLR